MTIHDSTSTPHTLWESGSLRCFVIKTKGPITDLEVHVFDGDSPICMERCDNADEAAILAERMWKLFVRRS